MKPNTQISGNKGTERTETRRFPITDCNYHSIVVEGGFSAPCAKATSRGFHTLSSEYFKTEANQYFLVEAGIFSAILAMAAFPLVQGASAVLKLLGA